MILDPLYQNKDINSLYYKITKGGSEMKLSRKFTISQILLNLILLISIIMLTNCGKDGKDGDVYISVVKDFNVFNYSDNNPDTPLDPSPNRYYKTSPGTYTFSYDYSVSGNTYSYTGEYILEANKGEEGGFLHDGKDGADKYYELDLDGNGNPTISSFDYTE